VKPAYSDDWTTVYGVDALGGLQSLPEKSVHCAVTSPPYWALRSYLPAGHPDKELELGAEKTPELYVEKLVEVFRGVWRVLRDDGSLWLNLGDSYSGGGGFFPNAPSNRNDGSMSSRRGAGKAGMKPKGRGASDDLKPKDLIGFPWMVAFALRADGWYLRSDIIWNKANPMPESVTDRPSKSHEYMFLLTKRPRYFFDQDAVRESHTRLWGEENGRGIYAGKNCLDHNKSDMPVLPHPAGRNIRSVWEIATRPYPGSHYATMPVDLVYPCVKAGTSEYGVCSECGAPWERVVEKTGRMNQQHNGPGTSKSHIEASGKHGKTSSLTTGYVPEKRTVGWQPTCLCRVPAPEVVSEEFPDGVVPRPTPATVLDPFCGSGTTLLAARKLGRRSIGIDLDIRNVALTEERLAQGALL